jgi:hypothetical protein
MTQHYNLVCRLYLLTAVVWALMWIPYGVGCYRLPWESGLFQILVQTWAWAHIVGGFVLAVYGARHEQRWTSIMYAMGISLMSLIWMYNLMIRNALHGAATTTSAIVEPSRAQTDAISRTGASAACFAFAGHNAWISSKPAPHTKQQSATLNTGHSNQWK